MKYKVEVIIDVPRSRMLELFEDMEFMKKWQVGFDSLTVIEGKAGTVGSKSSLKYINKDKESEIIETILKKELPDTFNFLYEAKGVTNWANNTFVEKGEQTLWIAEHEFEFSGLMKLLALMPKMFIKQTTSDMNGFKKQAEAI